MKKIFIWLIVGGVIIVGGLAATRNSDSKMMMPASSADSSNKQDMTVPNQVIMQGFEFKTKKLTVKKGTTVTWKNMDDAMHNIAFDGGSKAGTEGELFGKDKTYSVTFDEVGTYTYHCRPHPYMKASVEVTE